MASEAHTAKAAQLVRRAPGELGNWRTLAEELFNSLDVLDVSVGYQTLSEEVHRVPPGSTLLWPHARFSVEALESGASDAALAHSMRSHIGRLAKSGSPFTMVYDASTAFR
jgi:hypothetical protein